jgi:hypothetical protein
VAAAADLESDLPEAADDDGAADVAGMDGADHDGADDDELGQEPAEQFSGKVTQEEIEAEVAELLGEAPPPVERDHTRLFQEAAPDEEQRPPTD